MLGLNSGSAPRFLRARPGLPRPSGCGFRSVVRVPLIRDLIEPVSRYSLTDPTVSVPAALQNNRLVPRVGRPRGPSYSSTLKLWRESGGDRAILRRKLSSDFAGQV